MKKYIPFCVGFALFMQTLDSTIISTSIPKIAESLHTNPVNLKLALTSYLLSLALFIPISGWFADKYGTKNVFISSVVLFTLGSLLCGLSSTLTALVLSRIVQGMGGALMMPVGRLILLKSFAKSELIKVTNYATIPTLIGPALGPVMGGIIVSYVSWRWIFFVNIPFGILGAFISWKVLTTHFYKQPHKLDFIGFVLIGMGLAGLLLALESIDESMIPNGMVINILVASSAVIIIYFIRAHYIKHPFIDLKLFNIRTFGVTVGGGLVTRCGIGGMSFLLPLFFQLSLGKTPLASGLLLSFFAMGMLSMKFLMPDLLKLFGFKKLLISNTFLLGLSVWTFALIGHNTSLYWLIAILVLHGVLTSTQFTCLNVLSFADLSESNMSKGTSLATAIQQLSMSFGIAISAIILATLMGTNNPFKIDIVIFHETFFILGAITLLSTLTFMLLHPHDGHEVSGTKIELAEANLVKGK